MRWFFIITVGLLFLPTNVYRLFTIEAADFELNWLVFTVVSELFLSWVLLWKKEWLR